MKGQNVVQILFLSLWRRFQKGKKHNEDKVEVRRALNVNWVKLTFFLKRYILFTKIKVEKSGKRKNICMYPVLPDNMS